MIEKMSDEDLEEKFMSKSTSKRDDNYVMPDYESLSKELAKPGVTMQLLWEEYRDDCHYSNQKAYMLTQFKKYFKEYLSKVEFTDVIHHKAGESVEVDWCGTKAHYIDVDTGELCDAYLFVGVLSFSGYAFALALKDMKLNNWIKAHIEMFKYFGGVPKILIPDNLKTGVTKHSKNEIVLNRTYEEMAEYYNIIIIPSRVRRPKDKPLVENTVGKLTTHIIARLRNYQFFSLDDYNKQLRIELNRFNQKEFQKKDGSRESIFIKYEKELLSSLPNFPYEICNWKKAKVQNNSHISFEKNYYSVPYKYISKEVDLKIYQDRIEIYHDKLLITSHRLVFNQIGFYMTNSNHMPINSNAYTEWNSKRYLNWAKNKGPYTYQVIYNLFKDQEVEQRHYRTAHSILSLADKYSDQRLESACEYALSIYSRPRYKNVKDILISNEDMSQDNSNDISTNNKFLRGAKYFGNK